MTSGLIKRTTSKALDKASKKSKRTEATVYEKLSVIKWYKDNGRNAGKTKEFFNPSFPSLHETTILSWVRNEANLEEVYNSSKKGNQIRNKKTFNLQFDDAMDEWLMRKESDPKSRIDGNSIKMTAKKIQSLLEIPEPDQLTFSNGWLESFLKRKGLKMQRFHGEAASVNVDDVCSERTRVQQAIKAFATQGGSSNDVFNLDETSYFSAAIPDKVYSLSFKKVKQNSRKLV